MARRIPFWLVPIILLGLVMVGCGGVGGPDPDPDPDPNPDPTAWTITVTQSSPVPDPAYWVYILDRTPLLDWADITDAAMYEIQIAPDYSDVNTPSMTGSTPIIECSTSSYQVPAAYDWESDGYWRVRAIKADGTVSVWSMPFHFKVSKIYVLVRFPANNGLTDDTTPTLDWNDVAGATSYDLTLASNNERTFYEIFTVTGLTSSEYTLTAGQALTPGTSCYWFLCAKNDDGEQGDWSMGYKLTATSNTPVGNLRDGAATIDTTPEISWSTVSSANRYDLFIADSAAELDVVSAVSVTAPTTSYEMPSLLSFGTHKYWRVKVYNISEVLISTSADFDFVVSRDWQPLGSPNGVTSSTTPTLTWTSILGTDTYDVQVGLDPDFKDVVETGTPTVPSYDVLTAIPRGSSRYWRARAKNEAGDMTEWSPSFGMTISWNSTVSGAAPASGTTSFDQTPLLNWNNISYANNYEVWVSDTFPMVSLLSTKYTVSPSEKQLTTPLTLETTWYWRVRAKTLEGVYGDWSPTYQYTPSATVTLTPTTPADGSTDTDTTPTLGWAAVASAASYWVQIATSAAGVSSATSMNMGTNLSYTFGTAIPAGSYRYWRVQAKNDSGTGSAWTGVSSVGVTWTYAEPATSPVDGGDTTDTTPLLGWSAISGASSYQLQANLGSAPSDVSPGVACATNSYQVPAALHAGETWYWRIRPINSEGFLGPWSKVWIFNVK